MDESYSQVNVALSFMSERGCIERGRRDFPSSGFLYEDAMIEFMHLAETGKTV